VKEEGSKRGDLRLEFVGPDFEKIITNWKRNKNRIRLRKGLQSQKEF
jgi:hypothetical protein